ncbi:hypothetical protein ULMA_31480 [Patiriisocius marinus]|uniref:Lipoprotein n=1 Tax=Patiriisocius marinus TaxID=1397112 RepID=A0A5J4J572_9FLAO|nr:hypothetical protein [Patiriisocius marinus]GER61040.1 hypothetical protein ULMA_31480 [Patiriisocius marinus]
MKKILPSLIFCVFVLISCNKNRLSDTSWLVTKSYPIPADNENSILDGTIFHFKNNSVDISDIYLNESEDFKFKISKNQITIDNSTNLKIVKEYSDSIIIDYKNEARIKLIKLQGQSAELIDLRTNNWKLMFDNSKYYEFNSKLILTDSTFFKEPNSKMALKKNLNKDRFDRLVEKWNFKNINGSYVFAITNGQAFDSFFKVSGTPQDSILNVECLNCNDIIKAKLIKEKNLTEIERNKILSKLSDSKWKVSQIIDLDTISVSNITDSGFIPYNSLIEKQLTFEFLNDKSYLIQGKTSTKISGNWRLSSSGNEIILSDGKSVSDYIDILSIENDFIEIGNLNWFSLNDSYQELEIYYKLRLRNNGG